jgi:regulator of sirC expression with transglutaminase-like and TPR domain
VNLPAQSPRSRFAEMVARPEPDIDLAAAALFIAAEEYPQLSPEPYLSRLDELAERARDRQWDATAPVVMLQDLGRVLFEEEGFRGNSEHYYDPRNSFLNDVLDRRLGIPLTLSIIYLEVGWRLGLPLVGMNFPAHFMVRYEGEALTLIVDPFNGGIIRFEDEMQDVLDQAFGGSVTLQPKHLRQANRRDILLRMLENLKGTYLSARADEKALSALERILIIVPDSADHVRDSGMIMTRLGRDRDAAAALHRYLELMPDAPDRVRVELLLDQLSD